MKIAITSQYDDNYASLGRFMEANRKEYCARHGYELFIAREFPDKEMGFGFAKIKFLLDLCKTHDFDYVHWGGCDTLITNFNIKIEDWIDDNHAFWVAKEQSGQFRSINADAFIVKNSAEGRDILQFILDCWPGYKNHPWQEQQVMIDYFETPEFQNKVKIMPHQSFNSYPWKFYDSNQSGNAMVHKGEPGDFKVGDFLMHCPGHSLANRLRIFEHYIPQVVK